MYDAFVCTSLGLHDGELRGSLKAKAQNATAPLLELVSRGQVVAVADAISVNGSPDTLSFAIKVPAEILTDGVQTLLVRVQGSTETLASLPIVIGEPIDEDILAELDLLKAEVEMLKAAMRRHLGVTRY